MPGLTARVTYPPSAFPRAFTASLGLSSNLSTVHTPPSGELPIGGTHSLRGPQSYTLLSPNATVASPYTLAQYHAARDAAGVNGVVRIPSAASGVSLGGTLTLSVAGQTWQTETAAVSVVAGISVTAPNVTWEGGTITGQVTLPRAGNGNNFTARNFKRTGSSLGVLVEAKSGLVLSHFDFTGLVGGTNHTMLEAYYTQSGDLVDGLRLEHGISPVGMFTHHDGVHDGDPNYAIKNFVIHNCYLRKAVGEFFAVVEVFNHHENAEGVGAIVEYSDITGGQVILSIVGGSRKSHIHRNRFIVDYPGNPYTTHESAGSQQTGTIFEYNEVFGNGNRQNGARSGGVVFHNSSAHENSIRFNKIRDVDVVVSGGGSGGGYTINSNCLTNINNILQPGQPAFTIANIISQANPSTACGY